jgi:hypothetical protein
MRIESYIGEFALGKAGILVCAILENHGSILKKGGA